MPQTKYYYVDPHTKKRHFTRGVFTEWIGPLGFSSHRYAKFQRATTSVFIRADWLEPETLALLPSLPPLPPTSGQLAPTAPQVMTVERLRTMLKGCPPDYLVLLSRDEEGNGFSPLATISTDKPQEGEQGGIILWPFD
jgi:hypothetical protein